jgi:hypothetical protein
MLRFADALTPAATELVVSGLEIAADVVIDIDSPDEWRAAYPLLATCFTPVLARATLLDLVAKLRLPETYVPTEYHWLLLYECLKALIEVLNDDPALFSRGATDDLGDGPRCALSLFAHAGQGCRGFPY